MASFNDKLNGYIDYFEGKLNAFLNSYFNKVDSILPEGIRYAVGEGGKRVRPVLCLSVAEMLGISLEDVVNFAISIEFIHSYSLVHDDLPSMDNDDYRRGKLSTHKKYGEANGILIGDALLNLAFEVSLLKNNFNSNDAKALSIIGKCAGAKGMVLGQIFDLQNENNQLDVNEKELYKIYENKTAKLIIAPVLASSSVADDKYYNELYDFAYNLGILFQITDDIMDVEGTLETIGKTPNKDDIEGKLTAIKVFGIEGAKDRAKLHYKKSIDAISGIPNNDFLIWFAEKMYLRKK